MVDPLMGDVVKKVTSSREIAEMQLFLMQKVKIVQPVKSSTMRREMLVKTHKELVRILKLLAGVTTE